MEPGFCRVCVERVKKSPVRQFVRKFGGIVFLANEGWSAGKSALCPAMLLLSLACGNPLASKLADGRTEKYQAPATEGQGAFLVTRGGGKAQLSTDQNNPSVIISDKALTVKLNGIEPKVLEMGANHVDWKDKTYYVEVQAQPKVKVTLPVPSEPGENLESGGTERKRSQELPYYPSPPSWFTEKDFAHFYLGPGAETEQNSFEVEVKGVGRKGFVILERWSYGHLVYSQDGQPESEGKWLNVSYISPGEPGKYQYRLARNQGSYRLRVLPLDVVQGHPQEELDYYFYTNTLANSQAFVNIGEKRFLLRDMKDNGHGVYIFVDDDGHPLAQGKNPPSLQEKLAYGSELTFSYEGAPEAFWGYEKQLGTGIITPGTGYTNDFAKKPDNKYTGVFQPQKRNRYALGWLYSVPGERRIAILTPADFPPWVDRVEVLPEEQAKEMLKDFPEVKNFLDGKQTVVKTLVSADGKSVDCTGGEDCQLEFPYEQELTPIGRVLTITTDPGTAGGGGLVSRVAFRIHGRDADTDLSFTPVAILPQQGDWRNKVLRGSQNSTSSQGFAGFDVYYHTEERKDESGSHLDLAVLVSRRMQEDDPLSFSVNVDDPLARDSVGVNGTQVTVKFVNTPRSE